MAEYFDIEEQSALEQQLRDRFQSLSGMDAKRFDKCLQDLFIFIGLYGMNKAGIKRALSESEPKTWDVPEAFIDLVWDPILTKARSLAEYSFYQGLVIGAALLVFFLALFSQHLGIESILFIKPDAPPWARSKWVVVGAAVGLLVAVLNVFRGWSVLTDIQKNER